MNILLSNDDGVYAPGIRALYKVLSTFANVYLIAPLEEKSTTGHTLTLDSPLRAFQIEKNIYGVNGFPADCVLMGVGHLLKDIKIDLIVSGINRGANLGQDVYYSGTVAAAREGAFREIPAIAISSVMDFLATEVIEDHFFTAAEFLKSFLENGLHHLIGPLQLVNINVPDLKKEEIQGIEFTELGRRFYSANIEQRVDFRGRDYFWVGGVYQGFEKKAGTDCFCVAENKISITILNLLSFFTEEDAKWGRSLEKLTDWNR